MKTVDEIEMEWNASLAAATEARPDSPCAHEAIKLDRRALTAAYRIWEKLKSRAALALRDPKDWNEQTLILMAGCIAREFGLVNNTRKLYVRYFDYRKSSMPVDSECVPDHKDPIRDRNLIAFGGERGILAGKRTQTAKSTISGYDIA